MKNHSISLWCKRLTWLALLWLLSVAALAVVAYLLRFIMSAIGMTNF